jgi:hypothetical protein
MAGQPMQHDTRRSIFIGWGAALIGVALSYFLGGPTWAYLALFGGVALAARGHFPQWFTREPTSESRSAWAISAALILVLSISSGYIHSRLHNLLSQAVSTQTATQTARALLLGFDGAFAVEHSKMKLDPRLLQQEITYLNAEAELLHLSARFPADPMGSDDSAEPAAQFARNAYAELSAADIRMAKAFLAGWFGVITATSPTIKPRGFALRTFAKDAGFSEHPELKDTDFLELIVKQARQRIRIE